MSIKNKKEKKILIIDETGFSRICSAILENKGYGTDVVSQVTDVPAKLNRQVVDLIVTSYPYGSDCFDNLKKRNIPIIILSDNIDRKLMNILNDFSNSYCMIKPLDYDKFKDLVNQVISSDVPMPGGFIID